MSSLAFEEKKPNQFSSLIEGIKSYLLGMLIMPWILVWGYLFIISIFVIYFNSLRDKLSPTALLNLFILQNVNFQSFWQEVLIFILINYTSNFFLEKKYPQLKFFWFFTSVVILVFLAMVAWPYFQEVFRNL